MAKYKGVHVICTLDKWLRTVPDTPKIGNYGASVPAESNSLCDQAKQVGQAGDPNCG